MEAILPRIAPRGAPKTQTRPRRLVDSVQLVAGSTTRRRGTTPQALDHSKTGSDGGPSTRVRSRPNASAR